MSRLAATCLAGLSVLSAEAFAAQPPVDLGTADSFAVLAGSAVTNTGPSVLNGDLGVMPGTAISGFPPGTVNGTVHAADAVAAEAQSDLTIAYNDAAGRFPATVVPADLGGLTLTAGVYKAPSALEITGPLTLDAQGDPNAVFIFQVGSSLTTASGSSVNLINGAQPCNVFWQVGSSATLGTSSVFVGNILALTSVSIADAVTVTGRVLARNGAVTLINDTITASQCATPGSSIAGVPESAPAAGTPGASQAPAASSPLAASAPPSGTPPASTSPAETPPGTATPVSVAAGAGNGTAMLTTTKRSVTTTIKRYGTSRCVHGFRAVVTGRSIARVVFSLGGRIIATRRSAPFTVAVAPAAGVRTLTARVSFTDGTPAATRRMRFRSCAKAKASVNRPSRTQRTRSGFTG